MNKRLIGTMLLVFGLSLVAAAGGPPDKGSKGKDPAHEGMAEDHFGKVWAQFDANKDGKISMNEWHAGWGGILKQVDTNKDGSLSKDEAKAYSDAQKKAMLDAMTAHFSMMDTDKDGAVSKEEFKGDPAMFAGHDTNKDGKITADEADAAHKKMVDLHASNHDPAASFDKIDSDKNGKISLGELNGWAHALFTAYNTNKDDFLTKDELKAGMMGGMHRGKGHETGKPHGHGDEKGSGY